MGMICPKMNGNNRVKDKIRKNTSRKGRKEKKTEKRGVTTTLKKTKKTKTKIFESKR